MNNTRFENKNFNCIRFTNPNNSTTDYGDVHCVIRECKSDNWDDFRTQFDALNLFIDNESNETQNMDKFEFLYVNSEPIAFSINTVNQKKAKANETLEWIFPNNFEIKKDVVYLITFQNDKSSYITSENTRLINITSSAESAPLSTFFRRYNRGSINS